MITSPYLCLKLELQEEEEVGRVWNGTHPCASWSAQSDVRVQQVCEAADERLQDFLVGNYSCRPLLKVRG